VLLAAAFAAAQAQNGDGRSTAKPVAAKAAKVKPKTPEQVLLEQLDEKLHKLDELSQKYDEVQHKVDTLQQQLAARDAELDQARKDSAEVKQKLDAALGVIGPNGAAVSTLQTEVAKLKDSSSSLSEKVETTEQATKKLENPDAVHFKGIDITPGGFLAGETVNRQRAAGADVNTPFNSIPFAGQTTGVLSEFNASGRQSRVSLLAQGKVPSGVMRGYWEADFLSAGTTSNDNQSNSYTLRQRQAWAQAELNNGWLLTGGQMWSLATEYRHGLTNNTEATPLTIDAQYNVGFTWERQYGFRVVKHVGPGFWLGGAVEEAQTLNIGGHNLPTIAYQLAGNSGGLYNSTANYSFNYAPDLIAKGVYETNWGHFEAFGIGRFFRDRVYPNGPAPTGATQPVSPSALGAFTAKTTGGGAGLNARVALFARTLDIGAHVLAGNGIGRYSTATLPDATAHPDGSLELLTGGSGLGSVEWHATPRFDLYAYYNTGLTNTSSGPTLGQPILAGYGAPTNIVYGCYTETLPTNGLANGPSSTTCEADTRNIQEGTFGYWFRFYKGVHGTLQQGIQYSYSERRTWQGIGQPAADITNSPKAMDNMWFTSFRYYLPQ
jgi:FtsZ-binding cell division protein ZapB